MHSSLYADLRTNLPREIMGFSDFPNIPTALNGRSVDPRRFPAHPEVCGPCSSHAIQRRTCFPLHEMGAYQDMHDAMTQPCRFSCSHRSGAQVHAFLEAFADEFDLRRHIRFRTCVTRVVPLSPSGKWGAGPWAVTAEPAGSAQARLSSIACSYHSFSHMQVGNKCGPSVKGLQVLSDACASSCTRLHQLQAGQPSILACLERSRDVASTPCRVRCHLGDQMLLYPHVRAQQRRCSTMQLWSPWATMRSQICRAASPACAHSRRCRCTAITSARRENLRGRRCL